MSRALVEALVAELERAGVDTVFGLPGGGPNLDMIGAARAAGMRFVLAHGESAACVMAGTYGLLTGRPGACVVTRGPGVTSAANGLAQATLDQFPLLLVSDAVPGAEASRVAHQRFDQAAVTAPITKWSGTLGTREPAGVVAAALALAGRHPAGAVHLDFDPTTPGDRPPRPPPRAAADPRTLRRARELARAARRPVLLVGGEAVPAAGAVRALVGDAGCPAFTTYHARGLVPDSSPNAAGLFTGGALERPVLERADLVVAVGVDPAEPIPAPWPYEAPVVVLRPAVPMDTSGDGDGDGPDRPPSDPPRDPYFGTDVVLPGPIEDGAAMLRTCLRGEWEPGAGRAAREAAARALDVDAPGLSPYRVVDAVRRAAPPGARVTVDAGAHMLLALPMWPAEEPRRVLVSNSLATMGFAVPAAIGAALADPGCPVVCFVGDGGLGMTLAELETIARLGLRIAVVVFNDAALSLIEIKQRPRQGGAAAVRYDASDFAQVARGLGLRAHVARTAGDLERALAGPWQEPRLVDARVDPASYGQIIKVTRG